MTPSRVLLHIGAPKSGTTFLQSIMWENKEGLAAAGLLLPGVDQFDAFYATMTVREVTREKGLPDRAADAWSRLCAEAAEWDGDVVISHEFFAAANGRQAERAVRDLAPAPVHIVMTARDYVSQVPALWQEAVKVGSQATFGEFVAEMLAGQRRGPLGWGATDIVDVLDRWSRTIPAQNVHVVTVPPSGAPRDLLWRRYCQVLGIEPEGWAIPDTRHNRSMGAVQVELLRRVNAHLSPPLGRAGAPHYRWIRRYLAEDVLVSHDGRRFGVSRDAALQLRDRAESAVSTIGERGWHVVGDLDDLLGEQVDASRADPAQVTDEELVDEASATIAELVDRHRRADRAWRRTQNVDEPSGSGRRGKLRRLLPGPDDG